MKTRPGRLSLRLASEFATGPRDAVWVWQDRHDPFLVPRSTIEELVGISGLSEDELLAVCRERERRFAEAAFRKTYEGEGAIDPDGRLVIRSTDL